MADDKTKWVKAKRGTARTVVTCKHIENNIQDSCNLSRNSCPCCPEEFNQKKLQRPVSLIRPKVLDMEKESLMPINPMLQRTLIKEVPFQMILDLVSISVDPSTVDGRVMKTKYRKIVKLVFKD
ncbi:hypothetical protein NPIL_703581 [Nephila pilipes]|uniref:Uncharacterized protein n=1 Tax=Nephila pilipes TaxID=299642 RepID=A0A8X6T689_NEPPI|nr:hypothetical protein NPIL_703581 [Nephila pilipes]